MIFADHDPPEGPPLPPATPPPAPQTVEGLLLACMAEARHVARALAELDRGLGAVDGKLPRSLQRLDLLRQEAEGLAGALALVVAAPVPGTMLDPDAIMRATALHDQRNRLLHPPGAETGG